MDRDQNEVLVEDIQQPSLRKSLLNDCKILEVEREDDLRYNFTRKHPFELRNWSIFNLLDSEFILQIYMVMIFANVEANAAIIATRDKMVYALGNNVNGQLGLEDTHKTLYPRKIEILCGKVIKKFVYCSKMCNSALTEKGEVYLWGNNRTPSKTIGSTLHPLYQMKELNNEYIIDIACGTKYFLFLTKDGKVYFWGDDYSSETYIADVENDSHYIEKDIHESSSFCMMRDNLNGKKVVFIACGANFNIAVTDEDQVYSWGSNSFGQLGINHPLSITDKLHPNHSFESTPCKIITLSNKKIVKVVCGYAHALALTNEGELYTWGRNNYGQLAIPRMSSPPIMLKMRVKILDIAAVYLHNTSVALGSDGHIYIWGCCNDQQISTPTISTFLNINDIFISNMPYMIYNLMPADEYEHICETSNILKCLETAFDNSETSDFIIQVEGKPIHVHKVILIIRSIYFRNMFKHNWAEKNQNVVMEHKQFSYTVYKAFLKYLYTEVIELSVEKALELLDLANTYCDTKLKKHCREFIKKGLTVSNVIIVYITAIQGNIKDLEECSFQFIMRHTSAVVLSEHFKTLENKMRFDLTFRLVEAGVCKT